LAEAKDEDVARFISRWGPSGGGERSNYQIFLIELCRLIGVPEPEPSVELEQDNAYIFERRVIARHDDGRDTSNFIDLYKRSCFVLEAKQSRKRQAHDLNLKQMGLDIPLRRTGSGPRGGTQWDTLMRNAREQAESYAKRLPAEEGWPPFLVIVDVGHVIELYADFSLQGKHYAQFPDRQTFRIRLEDLRNEKIRERLRLVWTDPRALDPARKSAEVTREIAALLAELSRSIETRLMRALPEKRSAEQLASDRHAIAEKVALFLMRCLFTMFAEDVGLLTPQSFREFLTSYKGQAAKIHIALERLWRDMNKGGFSPDLRADVMHFNGGLFRDATAIEVTQQELDWLVIAAARDWKDVEPAIFGTLLERALDPRERGRLGAHYTPRAYVERLVAETLILPLTRDWKDIQVVAAHLIEMKEPEKARIAVRAFHRGLCATRVLDPACGTGNFLYVAMELMKRLEGEVLDTLLDLDDTHPIETVDPHQFLGLEINPRAVAIAELVLWIGYLQWHFRTRGQAMPGEPVLKNFANIREQDAVIAYDKWDVLRDENGRPVTRWDGITFKLHPITGEEIPDEAARIEMRTYLNPRPAPWPEAEFIIGNPPFIGGKDIRQELGDGYAEACWKARPHVPGGADFVMHFWDKAAETVRLGKARRFGLITTNSITQAFSRRVVERHLKDRKPLSLAMAIPDHPWLKANDKAAVRIAMTVGQGGDTDGALRHVVRESGLNTDSPEVELAEAQGRIRADLTIGADVTSAKPLRANEKLCSPGVKLHGAGFIITPAQAVALGLGKVPGLEKHILQYRNGRDLTARPRGVMVIDLYPLTEVEVRDRFPKVYQWVVDRVKPERDHNNRKSYRENWWIFGEPRADLRPVLEDLTRYIATVETSKHRFFQFLDTSVRPDNMLVNIGLEDGFFLGVLSSRIHVLWALAAGGRLGVGNDPRYNKTKCFDTFPFPAPSPSLHRRIGDLAEKLDAHRKAVLDRHPQLTMTKLYNVLEKVRRGATLTGTERDVYDAGLVGVLRQLHDDIDAAVFETYGWPRDLSDAQVLERLVALNHERAAEEARGEIRWLRPEFQAPRAAAAGKKAEQMEADLGIAVGTGKKARLPADLPSQVAVIRTALAAAPEPVSAGELSRRFSQGKRVEGKVEDVLRTLVLLGQAERMGDQYFAPR
jgi:hypothetical protein